MLLVVLVIGVVALTAGRGDSADRIARDACNLLERVEGEPTMDFLAEAMELEQRAREAGISDEEMTQAMLRRCPELDN